MNTPVQENKTQFIKSGDPKPGFWHKWKISLRNKILAGIIALTPAVLTIYFIKLFITFFDKIVSPILDPLIGFHIPGLGLIIALVVIYLLGLFITNILGKSLLSVFEKWLNYIPVVRSIYQTTKQVLSALSFSKAGFEKVVFIEYPRKNVWTIGFMTGETTNHAGKRFYSVFLPTTPNPTSGWVLFFPEDEVYSSDMSVEQGLKAIISAGAILPPEANVGPAYKSSGSIMTDHSI
ncbi:MAG: DUF502 domain-containing protein [Candidatus Marinimicrobia bacterium]|jgi:uncharacterized membrane protein|nr:DUF502 domain-containing protein [Candidatus Neomarinimicrobiota bacterium]MCK9483544.1 DUF502 domain-containing protein [Candidatus Neomarinimicrobiota bacterium]MCK9559878.1 DUF502 domain-containing protein [Candidatus Neomarinimicrobiota bacterium]MDD5062453.1 DUF502 domain-containing protein [Candidatus Neomarinimicrobiota bacterium]